MFKTKRGQVTVFIVLGIVMVVGLVLVIAFRGEINEIILEQTTSTRSGFEIQVDGVKEHVQSCLESSLKEGIRDLASKSVSDYEEELGSKVRQKMVSCVNFESFPNIDIKKLEAPEALITKSSDGLEITASLYFPILIQSEDNQEQIDGFVAKEQLKKRICVLESQLDNDCRALEDLKVGIFLFDKGEEVTIRGECLAC